MELFHRREPAAAIERFDRAIAAQPGHAPAVHFKGYALCQLGRFEEGVPLLEFSVGMQPRNADFRANLGAIRQVLGEIPEAIAELERAIAIAPGLAEAHSSLSLALRDAGDFDRALAAARRAVQLRPELPPARFNFAMACLAMGDYRQGWEAYRWRPDPRWNLRDLGIAPTLAHATSLPAELAGQTITLHGEQGLGDVVFFMRFAAALRERGARLRFWGDARIGPILLRNGLVDEAVEGASPPPGVEPQRLVWLGDLPALLAAAGFPPSIRLRPDAVLAKSARERLAALGPPPYVAVAWRAGLPRRGKLQLEKALDPAALGAALRGRAGTLLSVQRAPVEAQARALKAAAACALHDASALNNDLEEMLALLDAVDEHVTVSNTNVHLRAALGKGARILVPWPPEWRWMREGERSAWFPEFPLYRAARGGEWGAALERLASDLR